MLRPKQTKYKKQRKGRIRGFESGLTKPHLGSHGLKALEPGRITARQIEATRRAITRKMKRRGKVWIKVFPDVPVTSKPVEVRMGKGKGSVDRWVCPVRPGKILYEISGVSSEIAFDALLAGSTKLPIRTKIIEGSLTS